MDYQEYFEAEQQNMGPRYQPPEKPNTMAAGAMVCGILSLVSIFMCFLPLTFILAPCSIVLALLSKGSEDKMHSSARIGIITSICGFLAYGAMIGSILFLFYTSRDYRQSLFDTMNHTSQSMYGMDMEELMRSLYGDDIDIYEFFRLDPEKAPGEADSLPVPPSVPQSVSNDANNTIYWIAEQPESIQNFAYTIIPLAEGGYLW